MIGKVSKAFAKRYPDIFKFKMDGLIKTFVYYMIDSKYRKSVELMKWIKPQKDNEYVLRAAAEIPDKTNYDEQMLECWKWVYNNIKYIGDTAHWGYSEKWSKVEETLEIKKGDCEDMHNLLYCLCRAKGIPANRMLIWAGSVKARKTAPTGGHCSLLYYPEQYPMNPCFMDVCYYPNQKKIKDRNLFTLIDKDLIEWMKGNNKWGRIWSSYKKTWFIFNEDFSSSRYKPK